MSVFLAGEATMNTEPPWPPSPPSGPPRGTYFSRRKLRQPRPPCPAATWMSTSSTNIRFSVYGGSNLTAVRKAGRHAARAPPEQRLASVVLDRDDADLAAVLAVILEPDLAVNLREQAVIL